VAKITKIIQDLQIQKWRGINFEVKQACLNCGKLICDLSVVQDSKVDIKCYGCKEENKLSDLLGDSLKGEFKLNKRIGEGCYGDVYSASFEGKQIAAKKNYLQILRNLQNKWRVN